MSGLYVELDSLALHNFVSNKILSCFLKAGVYHTSEKVRTLILLVCWEKTIIASGLHFLLTCIAYSITMSVWCRFGSVQLLLSTIYMLQILCKKSIKSQSKIVPYITKSNIFSNLRFLQQYVYLDTRFIR